MSVSRPILGSAPRYRHGDSMNLFNVLGQTYDDREPCFIILNAPVLVWNRIDNRLYSVASLNRRAALTGHVFGSNEIGYASEAYRAAHPWLPAIEEVIPEPTLLATTAPRRKKTKAEPVIDSVLADRDHAAHEQSEAYTE